LAIFLAIVFYAGTLFAAAGCELSDPARDVKRIFPGSTGYKAVSVTLKERGGTRLQADIEKRLGDKLGGVYETLDVPYTIYEIYKGTETAGYIQGVNQKAVSGAMQVFLALDQDGAIRALYIQKLASRGAAAFRSAGFARQFTGLSLREFYNYDIAQNKFRAGGPAPAVTGPSEKVQDDFIAVMRAVKKVLVLMDEFELKNRHLPYFKETK
jgi:hypothetical protein